MKTYPANEPVEPFMFFRKEGFYIVEIPPSTVLGNVNRNEGTLKVLHGITQDEVYPKQSKHLAIG